MTAQTAAGRLRRNVVVATIVASLGFGITSSSAQFWDPFQTQRQYRQRAPQNPFAQPNWFEPQQQDAPRARPQYQPQEQDFSKAPPPKKNDQTPTTTVMVFGDSMADWLAYGLEGALSETPEIGILRRHKTLSGLIRQDVRSDPRSEHPDWPAYARQMLTVEKPDFVVMMLGINDRRPLRDRPAPPRPAPQTAEQKAADQAKAGATAGDAAKTEAAKSDAPKTEILKPDAKAAAKPDDAGPEATVTAEQQAPQGTGATYEFRSEKWAELYVRRIDETIAALKTRGVPVIWVGLPPVRGTRSMSEMSYLNDLYRGRAEKAGITYVDVWDGFVDDAGRFAAQGPDFEGQTRRLRASDGAYFTGAGARKLAHYVDREIQRSLAARTITVSLPAPEAAPKPQSPEAGKAAPGATPRPLSGPVIPLGGVATDDDSELLGNAAARQTVDDPMAIRVLVRGDAPTSPAGRADDFAWPRRGVAPLGADPVVAMTTLPIKEMKQAQRSATSESSTVTVSLGTEKTAAEAPKPRRPRPAAPRREQEQADPFSWGQQRQNGFGSLFGQQQTQIRIEPRRPPPAFAFPSLWGR